MIKEDEDLLICDLAEYYHIYDYRSFPPFFIGTLAWGLPADSRIKRKLSGTDIETNTLLMAAAVDRLSLLWWSKTEDGANNRNRPTMFTDILQGKTSTSNKDYKVFDSAEDFEEFHKAIMKG